MKRIYTWLIILLATEVLFVIICGPYSCEWGNTVYFYFGIAGLLVSFALPLIEKEWPLKKRVGFGLLFPVLWAVIWVAGFMLGGFRIMCKLF